MGINFHGSADAGVPDGFRECCQVKIGIVLVFDIIVGHISMSEAVDGYFVGQSYLFADLSMGLICTGANTTTKGEIGGSADILMLSTDYPREEGKRPYQKALLAAGSAALVVIIALIMSAVMRLFS